MSCETPFSTEKVCVVVPANQRDVSVQASQMQVRMSVTVHADELRPCTRYVFLVLAVCASVRGQVRHGTAATYGRHRSCSQCRPWTAQRRRRRASGPGRPGSRSSGPGCSPGSGRSPGPADSRSCSRSGQRAMLYKCLRRDSHTSNWWSRGREPRWLAHSFGPRVPERPPSTFAPAAALCTAARVHCRGGPTATPDIPRYTYTYTYTLARY